MEQYYKYLYDNHILSVLDDFHPDYQDKLNFIKYLNENYCVHIINKSLFFMDKNRREYREKSFDDIKNIIEQLCRKIK